jgi:hypothetical protein
LVKVLLLRLLPEKPDVAQKVLAMMLLVTPMGALSSRGCARWLGWCCFCSNAPRVLQGFEPGTVASVTGTTCTSPSLADLSNANALDWHAIAHQ